MPELTYSSLRPIDKSYAKALQLINSRTDFAWKHLKDGEHGEVVRLVRQIRDVSIKFLDSLEQAPVRKTRNGVRRRKAA
jgi:hypothetical protein